MKYPLALVCGTVVLLSLVSLNAAPGEAQSGWQPRVQSLESQVGELQAENSALQSQLEDLRAQVEAMAMQFDDHAAAPDAHHSPPDLSDLVEDVDDLEDLLMHFNRDGDDVFIEGANLHVTNGLGATDTTNGLGNIIIGYNEERSTRLDDSVESSVSTFSVQRFIATHEEQWGVLDDDIADGIVRGLEERANLEAVDYRSGSHVLVVGKENNYSGFGGIVVGVSHDLSADWSSIVGGSGHFTSTSATLSTIIGGWGNFAGGDSVVVVGGQGGAANGFASFVAGGTGNGSFPSASHSSIVGGAFHRVRGERATILGGELNEASGMSSTIVGGSANRDSFGRWSTVVGGQSNSARGENSVVVGGTRNRAEGEFSSVSEGCDRTVMTCGGP